MYFLEGHGYEDNDGHNAGHETNVGAMIEVVTKLKMLVERGRVKMVIEIIEIIMKVVIEKVTMLQKRCGD
jgi:hypothetical protein